MEEERKDGEESRSREPEGDDDTLAVGEEPGVEDAGEGEEDNGLSHRMVDPDRQPGLMQNPYAVHGLPPEDDIAEPGPEGKTWGGESAGSLFDGEKVSGPFVVGLLLVAAVVFVGLMFASHGHRIRAIEQRMSMLEERFEPENAD